jgi:hypothetical protein
MYLKLSVLFAALFFASCATNAPECGGPQSKNLAAAIDGTQTSLINGCHAHFDRYYDDLLSIAEGDPKPENKRAFSEFLVWSSDQGLLSKATTTIALILVRTSNECFSTWNASCPKRNADY